MNNPDENNMAANIFGSNILRENTESLMKEENPTLDLLNAKGDSMSSPAPMVTGNPTLDLLNQSTESMAVNPPVLNDNSSGFMNQPGSAPVSDNGFNFIPLRAESESSVPANPVENPSMGMMTSQPNMNPNYAPVSGTFVSENVFGQPTQNNMGTMNQSNMMSQPVTSSGMVQQSLDSLFPGNNNSFPQ